MRPSPGLTSLTVQPTAFALVVDETVRLAVSRAPVAWTTSDAAVAQVSSSGLVTGKAAGSTTLAGTVDLTATAVDDRDVVGLQFQLKRIEYRFGSHGGVVAHQVPAHVGLARGRERDLSAHGDRTRCRRATRRPRPAVTVTVSN